MEVVTKQSNRAKRIQIRIHKGQVLLVYPSGGCKNKAIEFFQNNQTFINKQLAKQHKIDFSHGSTIKILGKEYMMVHSGNLPGGVIINEDKIVIYGGKTNLEYRLKNFLAFILDQKIKEIALDAAKQLHVSFNKISIKETYTRWGSCSSKGNLSFSLKLVFLDEEILKYVVVHEVCHLKEMNHSKKFWGLVESLYPAWREASAFLKVNGNFFL